MKQSATLVQRLTRTRNRAKGHDLQAVLEVAFSAALQDQRPYCVGATYFGYRIGNFPTAQKHLRVMPNGEVYSLEPVYDAPAATGRPGDAAAVLREKTGIPYGHCLVMLNMD